MTILAITLTTTLFSALFSTLLGLKNSFDEFSYRSFGTSADAQIAIMDEEAEETVKSADNISKIGYVKKVGAYTNELLFNTPASVMYADDTAAEFTYINPTKGTKPVEEDDIVMDTFMMSMLGIEEKVGAEAEITFITDSKIQVTHKFNVTGYYQVSGNCPEHVLRVSEKFADKMIKEYDLQRYLGSHFKYSSFLSPAEDNAKLEQRLKDAGSGSLLVLNAASAGNDLEENIELIACGSALCLIVFITGFLIINNIFRIKLASEIRYYGLLKTIGVTAKQLKRLIRNETLILCGVGVPVGLLIGYAASRLITPQLMLITSIETASASTAFLPAVLIFSAIFSIVTVLISNSAAISKTSKVSPIEALRYNEAASFKRAPKTKKHGVSALVAKSLKINKSKTIPVILSLALAISLFTGVSFLTNGISQDMTGANEEVAFEIANRDYFLGNPDGLPLTKAQIDTFKNELGGELTGCTYESDQVMIDLPGNTGKETDPIASIVGVDDSLLSLFNIEDLPDLSSKEPYPAIIEWTDDLKYDVGDVVELTINTTQAIDKETGEPLDINQIDLGNTDNIEFQKESNSFKIKIVAGTNRIPDSVSPKYSFLNSVRFVVNKDALEKITKGKFHTVNYLIDTKDKEEIEQIESYLSDLTDNNAGTLRYRSRATTELEYQNLSKSFSITGYFLCVIVGIIAVLNFVNAVMTEAVTRRREFALLRAVGTTSSQVRALLIRECIFYTAGAFVLGLPLEIFVMSMLKAADIAWIAVTPASLAFPFVILLPLFAILSFVVPTVIYSKNSSKSIMDEFRETY